MLSGSSTSTAVQCGVQIGRTASVSTYLTRAPNAPTGLALAEWGHAIHDYEWYECSQVVPGAGMPPPPTSTDGWEVPTTKSRRVGDLLVQAPVPLPSHTEGRAGLPLLHTVASPMSVFLLAEGLAEGFPHKLAAVARELWCVYFGFFLGRPIRPIRALPKVLTFRLYGLLRSRRLACSPTLARYPVYRN